MLYSLFLCRKRELIKLLILLTGSLLVGEISGQAEYSFTRYTPEDGYVQGIVTDIHQDTAGFIWIATADGLFRYDGYKFKEYRRINDNSNSIHSNTVICLANDQQRNLWIGTQGGGLTKIDAISGLYTHFQKESKEGFSIPDNDIGAIFIDKQGWIWVGTSQSGLLKMDGNSGEFEHFRSIPGNESSLSANSVNDVLEDSKGRIWVGTGNGLNYFDPQDNRMVRLFNDPNDSLSLSNNIINFLYLEKDILWIGTADGLSRLNTNTLTFLPLPNDVGIPFQDINVSAIVKDTSDQLWIGTYSGLYRFDEKRGQSSFFENNPQDNSSLSTNRITDLHVDKQGLLWVGTWGNALNRLNASKSPFLQWSNRDFPGLLPSNDIKSIYQSRDSILWVGTKDNGVARIDRNKKTSQTWTTENGLSHNTVYTITGTPTGVWIGTSYGLNYYDELTGELYQYLPDPNNPRAIPNRLIWSAYYSQSGQLWIGTDDGLAVLSNYEIGAPDLNLEVYTEEQGLSFNSIRCIYEDKQGGIWIGTSQGGLNYFDIEREQFSSYQVDPQDSTTISDNYIYAIGEDRDSNIWVGTPVGACRLDKNSGKFLRISEKNGLPNDYVFAIKEDAEGNLWMSTNRGIFKYDQYSQDYRVYNILDGLQDNEFNQGASFQDPETHEIFFGGVAGLNSFDPKKVKDNQYKPPLVVSRFAYYNSSSNGEAIEIPQANEQKEIVLSYKDNILEIEFAALNFIDPEKNQYKYQLVGFNEQLLELSNNNKLTFTNLDHGKYTLQLKGSNNDRVWNDIGKEVQLTILPPWYETTPAKGLFVLIFILGLWGIYNFLLNRRLALKETERLQELDQLKTKFFTNIAHEFKTPLTVILGMLSTLKNENKAIELIKRNSYGMLDLVNQMLDLRKLESGKLSVNLVQSDIVKYIRLILESFESFAKEQEVKLHFLPARNELVMDFDPDKILRILSNLLSNAIKYNRRGGDVYLQMNTKLITGTNHLSIVVRDTGIGIPSEKIPHIFERFYQVEDKKNKKSAMGTGIGLSLTKELVNLFQGDISVSSKDGEETIFTVLLPIHNEAVFSDEGRASGFFLDQVVAGSVVKNQNAKSRIQISEKVREEEGDIKLLVIEDNHDVVEFLKTCLAPYYLVEVAYDGEAGIQMAIETVPDIIISDVMMPKKDGFEVLQTLKDQEATSHIPIIMLSAKSDLDSRIKGLEKGAEIYLGKPFHPEELLAHLNNLLQTRKRLQKHFLENKTNGLSHKVQDPFVDKVIQCIEKNIEDERFGINELCKAIGVSRTQLHNKLKAITGLSASHFINSIRLKRAHHLLLETQMGIAEIAFAVGYKEPNYFSKLFLDFFGKTPTDTRK